MSSTACKYACARLGSGLSRPASLQLGALRALPAGPPGLPRLPGPRWVGVRALRTGGVDGAGAVGAAAQVWRCLSAAGAAWPARVRLVHADAVEPPARGGAVRGGRAELARVEQELLELVREGQTEDAFSFLERYQGWLRSSAFDKVLEHACAQPDLPLVERIMQVLRTGENTPTPELQTYNRAIQAYSDIRPEDRGPHRVSAISQYYKDLQEGGLEPSLDTYHALIHAFGMNGGTQGLRKVLYDMREKQVAYNGTTYERLMQAYSAMGEGTLLVNTLKSMRLHRVEPSTTTYEALLEGLATLGNVSSLDYVAADMKAHDARMTTNMYNELMRAYAVTADVEGVDGVFANLQEDPDVKPNVRTYNLLMDAYGTHRGVQQMLEVYDILCARTEPNVDTYNVLIRVFGEHADYAAARAIYDQLRPLSAAIPHVANLDTYLGIMKALGSCDRPEEVVAVVQHMLDDEYCTSVPKVAFSRAVSVLCSTRQGCSTAALEDLLSQMKSAGSVDLGREIELVEAML